jgi:carboxymethylenebutenolidase
MSETVDEANEAGGTVEQSLEWGRLHRREDEVAAQDDPGIVLIHDVWGPSEHSRALARDLAREGFQVLEIDLYRELRLRKGFKIEEPGAFIRSLSDPEILADLEAAGRALAATPADRTVSRRVGVMGVCMGGTYALLAACSSRVFEAAAPFYGILSYDDGLIGGEGRNGTERDRLRKPLSPIEAAPNLRMPLLASFGGEDPFVPLADVERLERALSDCAFPHPMRIHPGAGHAFLNRTRPEAYQREASQAAWAELIPFFRRHLARS